MAPKKRSAKSNKGAMMRVLAIFGAFTLALTTVDTAYEFWSGYTGRIIEPSVSVAYALGQGVAGRSN